MKANSFSSIKPLRQRQAGYTLIELSISLAIIAVLLVGTLTGVQRLLGANNANNTITQTQSALTNIIKLFASTSEPDIYETIGLAQMGAWERTAVIRTPAGVVTGVRNPFGGTIFVAQNTGAFSTVLADRGFWYRLNSIPGESCASLATSLVNTADAIYITALPPAADSTVVPPAPNGAFKTSPSVPLNTGNLATGCSTLAADGTVTVHLYVPST